GAERPPRSRRVLTGLGDVVRAGSRQWAAAAGGADGAVRLRAPGPRLRPRSRRARRLPRGDRPRQPRPPDPPRSRRRGAPAAGGGGCRRPLARDAGHAHDRPADRARAGRVRPARDALTTGRRGPMEFRRIDDLPPYVFAVIRDLTLELRRAGEDVID